MFCSRPKKLEKKLQEIGGDVCRVVDAIAAKRIFTDILPPSLPDMAEVPVGALELPHSSYVERAAVQEVADGLTNPEEPRTPYTVVGIGGGGKSVLASAVVRMPSVREHFRGGISWVRVGRGAKNSLLPLLQGLAREVGAAPTDAPHGVPHALDSLEQVQQHLAAVASTRNSPRLVVLDDVWEREVVDAFVPLGFKLLLTTRDRSIVCDPAGRLELGDMTEEEALELLRKTSGTVDPGDDVRMKMTKVVALCGHLPLVLAIAGSMSAVKGKGLTAVAWEELAKEFENVAKKMRARGQQSSSIKVVLETTFDSLATRKQKEFLMMAVLAAGALAPIEMLSNLWEIEDAEGTHAEAEGLVSKYLLHAVGGGGYRMHDLVLDFAKTSIRAEEETVKRATALQAQYLGRLDVVESYGDPEHGAGDQGIFFLDALWRSVEKLSGDPQLEVASYRASLGALEWGEATEAAARSYFSVGFLFNVQGKYDDAESLYKRSLATQEKVLGQEHPDVAQSLNDLAGLLRAQGKYAEAEPLYEQSQAIREKVLGPEHPDVATTLNDRARLLESQGKYVEAEPLYERCQAIYEKAFGPEHPDMAATLHNQAGLLCKQRSLGLDHPDVAASLNNGVELLIALGKYADAMPLVQRSLAIREDTLGVHHPDVAASTNSYAELLKAQGRYDEAALYFERAGKIWENALGPKHPMVATALYNQAELLETQGKYHKAEELYRQSLAIREQMLGADHPDVAVSLNNMARLLATQDRNEEAEALFERAIAVLEAALGPDHPNVAIVLINQAGLLMIQGKYAEAEVLCQRSLKIQESTLGPDHPDVATSLHDTAGLLELQGNYDEAEPLYRRAQTIREKMLGPDHPKVAASLNSLAGLLTIQCRYKEAEGLYERAAAILEVALGPEHPNFAAIRKNWLGLLEKQGRHEEAAHLSEHAPPNFSSTAKGGSMDDSPFEGGDGLQGRALILDDMKGASELHKAAYGGDVKLVEEILSSRSLLPDIRGNISMTPLHYAVIQGHRDCVWVLLRHGANPDLQNSSGLTALHMACANLSHQLVKLLMDSGADPNMKDDRGLEPKGHAQNDEELELLLTLGKGYRIGSGKDAVKSAPQLQQILPLMLTFLDSRSWCQCLSVGRSARDTVRALISGLMPDGPRPEEGWTVPLDVLTLKTDDAGVAYLAANECGIAIHGEAGSLAHLKAVIVPPPQSGFISVEGEQYIATSPILRCRWTGNNCSQGTWTVSFPLEEEDGLSNPTELSQVLCRGDELQDEWEVQTTGLKAATRHPSMQVEVTHFSDIITADKLREIEAKSTSIVYERKRSWFFSKHVRVYNASSEAMTVLQILPAVTESARSGQVSVPGGGLGGSRSINVNDGNSVDDWQEIPAWVNASSETGSAPPTNPAKLRTRLGMKAMRVIPYTVTGSRVTNDLEVFPRHIFECLAGYDYYLLQKMICGSGRSRFLAEDVDGNMSEERTVLDIVNRRKTI
ncbi:NB-ARC and TPR repeat-containing protein [Ectocarpus siliculosus]|uniref:NB-ARC and TPR repeat-containing protein n=1 Tax=Ectocarpus siliculosus TaxID=2880 RepID=D7FUD7_ECTSI|nr:NB-ARC and TPR repeat-containing protein [Ectocarpus siliculosus]|eukprot:CBJ26207.1 NB-ARC and TPR repeat-containing protein [Ectocarpus siliculosus]